MTTYSGVRSASRVDVFADGEPLCPRHDLHPLSQAFDWGYPGTGPSQLALALLADHWPSDENRALADYRRFMRDVIARIRSDRWELTGEDIDRLLAERAPQGTVRPLPRPSAWEVRDAF